MLRLPFVALLNLLVLLRALLGLPARLLRARHRPTWVRLRLKGELPYRTPPRRRFSLRRRAAEPAVVTSLEVLGRALRLLARDPHLVGVLLEVEGLAAGPAKREALGRLLADFRAAGKRVVGWAVQVDNDAYEVLCACDEAWIAPAGRVDLVGFAAEVTALGEGLERLGVRAHFVRRGDYKTAPELFTHADVSDIQRKTVEAFLDERYGALLEAVCRGRGKTPEEARALVDGGPYSARRAVAVGLADAAVSEQDLPARLGLAQEGAEGRVEALPGYLAALPWPPLEWRPWRPRPRLALVPVRGMIVPGKGGGSPVGPQVAGADAVVRAVRQAARDRRARAIVLYVDSPGGSAVASELMLEAVRRAAKTKPLVAYVDRVAASGGYMAALGAKELWSAPHAVVGSIGVFAGKFDLSGLLGRLGVRRAVIARGENAAIHSSSRGFTEHERASLEAEVEETYRAFLSMVSGARGLSVEEVHARAEGRVYSGTRALAQGLVDRIGGFDDACRRALELAGVTARDFELATYAAPDRRLTLLKLLGALSGAQLYALCPTSALAGLVPHDG